MKTCWNCNDPLPDDTNTNICSACARRIRLEDFDELCPDDPIVNE